MDVNVINIMFCKDYKKELDVYPNNAYLTFAPVNSNHNDKLYLKTEFSRKDITTYIKHRRANLWICADKDNNLIWDNITCDKNGFYYKEPQLFFIDYYDNQLFTLYVHKKFGSERQVYLRYTENGTTLTVEWVPEIMHATFFHWPDYQWSELTWLSRKGERNTSNRI